MIKLRVTDIKQYIYCPRIIYFTYVCPVRAAPTGKMAFGREAHQELDRLEKRRVLGRYQLAGARRIFHTPLHSPRLGLEGRLDMHLLAGREVYPVEFKMADRFSLNHKYQLVAYAMLLEEMYRYPVRQGFVLLHPRGEVVPVEITPAAREYVRQLLEKIRLLVQRQIMPPAVRQVARCADCEYQNFCNDVR
ncbi:MAG: CRISPR-associated protein Cas4 [Bacillota bacterium]